MFVFKPFPGFVVLVPRLGICHEPISTVSINRSCDVGKGSFIVLGIDRIQILAKHGASIFFEPNRSHDLGREEDQEKDNSFHGMPQCAEGLTDGVNRHGERSRSESSQGDEK